MSIKLEKTKEHSTGNDEIDNIRHKVLKKKNMVLIRLKNLN